MPPTSTARALPERQAAAGHPRGHLRRPVLVVLGLSLPAVCGVVGWQMAAAASLDDVGVRVAGNHCDGEGTVVRDRPRNITVETAEDMRCTFSVQVENHGKHAVHLGDVRAVVMGPDTGAVIRAKSIDGLTPRGDGSGVDAVHTLDRSVLPGESVTFDIVTVFNPEGCNAGGTLMLYRFPQLEVSALGVDRMIDGNRTLSFQNDIRTPGCA